MPDCQKCRDIDRKVAKTKVSGAGQIPTTLELAHMVNLEYSIDINKCVHEIPESKNAKIRISDMVEFLEERNWHVGTQTNNEGKVKLRFHQMFIYIYIYILLIGGNVDTQKLRYSSRSLLRDSLFRSQLLFLIAK